MNNILGHPVGTCPIFHHNTLSVSLNAMRATLLPTVRTVHALHHLNTKCTPWPSGNWEAQGSISGLPSLAWYTLVVVFRRFRITVGATNGNLSLRPSDPRPIWIDSRVLTKSVCWEILTKSRQSLQCWCRSHNFNNIPPHGLFRIKTVQECKQTLYVL